jgi:prolyl 4-hydroxylase
MKGTEILLLRRIDIPLNFDHEFNGTLTPTTLTLSCSYSIFVPSQVFTQDSEGPQHRTSSSCSLPPNELLPSVVAARTISFLDSISAKPSSLTSPTLSYYGVEPLQLVKYATSQYYRHHVDWFDGLIRDDVPGKGVRGKGQGRLYNRVASIFLYLKGDCVGGGTEFPDLMLDNSTIFAGLGGVGKGSVDEHLGFVEQDEQNERSGKLDFWQDRVEIEDRQDIIPPQAQGTIFKPRKGSGIFWVNLHESGFGDQRVMHAGLPVREGEKVGMNIWVKRDFGW